MKKLQTVFAIAYIMQFGYEDQALALFTELAKLTREEPGNISFIVHRSPRNPRCNIDTAHRMGFT